MGIVVSSVVAAGPAVLGDLETPYAVLQDRKKKEREKGRSKSRSRRPQNQIKFDQRLRNIWVIFPNVLFG